MLRRAISFAPSVAAAAAPSVAVASLQTAARRDISNQNADAVLQTLKAEGTFNPAYIEGSVSEFKTFNLPESYNQYYTPAQIAEHVRTYMSAKISDEKRFDVARERDKYAFYWCEDSFDAQLNTIRKMEKFILQQLKKFPGHAVSVASYNTGGERNAIFFGAQLAPFTDPSGKGTTIESLTSKDFMARKRPAAIERYQRMIQELRSSIAPVFTVSEPLDDGTTVFTVACNDERLGHLSALVTMISHIKGATVARTFCESFSDRAQVYSIFVRGCSKDQLRKIGTNWGLMPQRPHHPLFEAYRDNKITHQEVIFGHAMMIFCQYFTPMAMSDDFVELQRALKNDEHRVKRLQNMRQETTQQLVTDTLAGNVLAENPDLLNALFADFEKGATEASTAALQAQIDKRFAAGTFNNAVLSTCVRFVASIRRSNFFCTGRAAVCYRLDPSIVLKGMDFPRIPYGIYLVVGSDFRGFHVRFHDIARGGVRLIVSNNDQLHIKNKRTLFQENYNLAYTQTLKNKDIPESGSKGTILVSMRCPRNVVHYKRFFLQYVDSLLDNMQQIEGVRDTLGTKELLFLGPDENTAGDFPSIAAQHARKRGFANWKSLTTGKEPSMGGVPHDIDGMTTRSVRQCVDGIYRKLGLDGTKMVKFMTGGPDGDLGGNEIKYGTEPIRGICDGTAALVDLYNIDKAELLRLATNHLPLSQFNPKKVGPKGVFVLVSQTEPITGPNGEVYINGEDFRNKLHFHPWSTCETFVPCGGRPAAVNISNVHHFLINSPGVTGESMLAGQASISPAQLRFKYIVEGANLFITQDARLALERCGVVLIKDSTANKGGVTSSSIEVFTGLALSDAQHAELMCVKDAANPPAFYTALKRDIISRVESNARMEFECIWRDSQAGHQEGLKALISDVLSRKIVRMVEFIHGSTLDEDAALFRFVINEYTPKTLLSKVSLDQILERVPRSYLKAIFAKSLASQFVYTYGGEANDFAFFEFMRAHLDKAHKWNKQQ